jgi:hypothetical protein
LSCPKRWATKRTVVFCYNFQSQRAGIRRWKFTFRAGDGLGLTFRNDREGSPREYTPGNNPPPRNYLFINPLKEKKNDYGRQMFRKRGFSISDILYLFVLFLFEGMLGEASLLFR